MTLWLFLFFNLLVQNKFCSLQFVCQWFCIHSQWKKNLENLTWKCHNHIWQILDVSSFCKKCCHIFAQWFSQQHLQFLALFSGFTFGSSRNLVPTAKFWSANSSCTARHGPKKECVIKSSFISWSFLCWCALSCGAVPWVCTSFESCTEKSVQVSVLWNKNLTIELSWLMVD